MPHDASEPLNVKYTSEVDVEGRTIREVTPWYCSLSDSRWRVSLSLFWDLLAHQIIVSTRWEYGSIKLNLSNATMSKPVPLRTTTTAPLITIASNLDGHVSKILDI